MTRPVTIDLDAIIDDLGDHYRSERHDRYQAECPRCLGDIPQDTDVCSECDSPVIWYNSRAWRAIYGSPSLALRRLTTISPREPAGERLCRLAGVDGFANKAEALDWGKVVQTLGQRKAVEIVLNCAQRSKGRGLIRHAINYGLKVIREFP